MGWRPAAVVLPRPRGTTLPPRRRPVKEVARSPQPSDTRGVGAAVASSVLVGREAELAALRASLSAAASGSPKVLLVAGEAGIGKSRLVGAFEAAATEAGFTVLRGDCVDPGGSELAYAPLVAALRDAPDAA